MIDVVSPTVFISIGFFQLLHDVINFCCFRLPGRLLLEIIGSLHFNVGMDSGYSVGLTIEEFRWRFIHGEGVFVLFEVVST